MKLLLRDYVRRFWWMWLIGYVLYAAMLGLVLPVKFDISVLRTVDKFGGLINGAIILGLALMSATVGLIPLLINLANGSVLRVLLTMPVSLKEIGRAWWWATVGIPILALGATTALVWAAAALLFAAAPEFGNEPLTAAIDFKYWLASAALLGTMFLLFSCMPPLNSPRSALAQARGSIAGWLLVFLYILHISMPQMGIHMFDVFSVAVDPFRVPETRWWVIVVIGLLSTILGWVRAGALAKEHAVARTSFRIPPRNGTKPSRCAEGPGGLRFLVQVMLGNMVLSELIIVSGFTIMVLVLEAILGGAHEAMRNYPLYVKQNDPYVVKFAGFQGMSLIMMLGLQSQIRAVRAMPISTAQLAISLVLTPLVALLGGLYVTRLCLSFAFHVPSGPFWALNWQWNVLPVALVAALIPMLAWRGQGTWPALTMSGGMMACMFGTGIVVDNFSPVACAWISTLLICASVLATKGGLDRSGHAYHGIVAGQIGYAK